MKRGKNIAAFGLAGILLIGVLVIGLLYVFHSPNWLSVYAKWKMKGKYLGKEGVLLQDKRNNCGITALKMIFDYYEIPSALDELEKNIGLSNKGSNMFALKKIAERKGLLTEGWKYSIDDFLHAPKPALIFLYGNHFAVVDSVTSDGWIVMRDPAIGKIKVQKENLDKIWDGETLIFHSR